MKKSLEKEKACLKNKHVQSFLLKHRLGNINLFHIPNQPNHNLFFTGKNLESGESVVIRIWDTEQMDKRLLTSADMIPKELLIWSKIMGAGEHLPGIPRVKFLSKIPMRNHKSPLFIMVTSNYYSSSQFTLHGDSNILAKATLGLQHTCLQILDIMKAAQKENNDILFRLRPQDIMYSMRLDSSIVFPTIYNFENCVVPDDFNDLNSHAFCATNGEPIDRSAILSIKNILAENARLCHISEDDDMTLEFIFSIFDTTSLPLAAGKSILSGSILSNDHFANFDYLMDFVQMYECVPTKSAHSGDGNDNNHTQSIQEMMETLNFFNGENVTFEFNEPDGEGFNIIAGMNDVKQQLKRLFMPSEENGVSEYYGISHHSDASRCSKGVLLHGPSGSGKTFIAKCLAAEMQLPYIIVDESMIGSENVHGTPMRITQLFKAAIRKSVECGGVFVIIDEIDAYTPKKDNFHQSKVEETNAFLTSIQECANYPVYIVGTTNRPDIIEPAMLRQGRLGTKIYIPLPDQENRSLIFSQALQKCPVESIDYSILAEKTRNFTASDIIEKVVNETIQRCIEAGKKVKITTQMLLDVVAQANPSVSENDRRFYEQICSNYSSSQSGNTKSIGFHTTLRQK